MTDSQPRTSLHNHKRSHKYFSYGGINKSMDTLYSTIYNIIIIITVYQKVVMYKVCDENSTVVISTVHILCTKLLSMAAVACS